MSSSLILIPIVVVALIVVAVIGGERLRALRMALLAGLAAFSGFGFLASFEPTEHAALFRILYGLTGMAALIGMGLLVARRPRQS